MALTGKDEFLVVQGAIEIEYVDVLHSTPGSIVIEIGTRQKYPQAIGYSSVELHIGASERTRADSYDAAAPPSTVMFPSRLTGWDVLPDVIGRYSLRVALYKPNRTRSRDWMRVIPEEERIRRITEG